MPTRLEGYSDDSGSSGKKPYLHQSSWMPCSNRLTRKHGSFIVPHSQTLCKEEGLLHQKQKRMCTTLNLTSDIPSYIRVRNLGKDGSDSEPFGLIGHSGLAPRILMDPSCSYETHSQSSRKRNRSSTLVLATSGSDLQAQSDKDDPIEAMVVSTRFRDSNFATPGDGSSMYGKFSAILLQERNGLSAVLSRGLGNPPLFSQTETHSFFITKRAGADMSKQTHNGGVKIQPLWSSTDSESQTPEDNLSCEPSTAETDKRMELAALSNKNDSFGVILPSLVKVSQDKTLHTSHVDAKEDKARGKLPNTSAMEASSSRTQSLEVEQLLSCTKQPSDSMSKPCQKEAEPSNRWVKRLKPSSSEVGESPAHTPSPDPEQSMVNGESSSRKKSNDAVFQSSWIQRWCQEHTVAKHRRLRKGAVVTCEPDSSKVGLDEMEKKQFPSIAAMALMGKSMSGFRPCKLTKRGALVIWNTEDT